MLLIKCPYCEESRPELEFHYEGEAHIARPLDPTTVSDEEWAELHELNLMSAVRCTRHFLPDMRDQKWGRVIMIASGAAKYPGAALVDYAATKAAMVSAPGQEQQPQPRAGRGSTPHRRLRRASSSASHFLGAA